ncbi:MAG: sensor histidine kinase [Chloroflexaceae bacterium]|nr:sensor histidine kinase [Chloroflexaceae bacterium]NJO04673.1 sensor histidine kinase [Chloroflexaceae bacterium]
MEQARTSVVDLLTQLRSMIETAQQRDSQLTVQLRQAERALDEVTTQRTFAVERNLPTAADLEARERELRQTCTGMVREVQEAQRVRKQLDQLVRQIDMSSGVLSQAPEDERADPWALALRSQVVLGREEERVRLAREVHDGPAQVLANSLMLSEQCRSLLRDQRTEQLGVMLERLCSSTREGLHEVRQFIADLRPGQLAEQGLLVALQDYTRRYHDLYNVHVNFEADGVPRMAIEVEIVLYRIAQEALQNAHKHARGAAVYVQLVRRQNYLLLTVRDDGPGFDPRAIARRTGRESWGLTSMRERAELIGARFRLASQPGQGTEVSVAFPLH